MMKGLFSGIVIVCLVLAQGAGMAAPTAVDKELAKAQLALSAGNYDDAYKQYQHIYKTSQHPLAAFSLGMFYRSGWGRPADPVEACRWFDHAAQGKLPTAEYFLGDCLLAGVHQAADPAKAAYWYEQAARGGNGIALCSLAALYVAGNGVDKDPQKGLALCRGVAEQGSTPAMIQMGWLLLGGRNATADASNDPVRDPAAAYTWFERAAQNRSAEAQYQLGVMSRDGLGHDADPALARHWFEAAAVQGYVAADYPTARLYFDEPPDPATGNPSAETLAKSYLWLTVTSHCSKDPTELKQSGDMLEQVRQIMPATWVPSLNEKLSGHLCEQSASCGAGTAAAVSCPAASHGANS